MQKFSVEFYDKGGQSISETKVLMLDLIDTIRWAEGVARKLGQRAHRLDIVRFEDLEQP